MRQLLPVFLTFLFVVAACSQTAIVLDENTVVRSSSSQNGSVHGILSSGVRVSIIKRSGSWVLIKSSQMVGWVRRSSLKIENSPRSAPVVNSPAKQDPAEPKPAEPKESQPSDRPAQPEPMSELLPNEAKDTILPVQRVFIRGPRGGCYYLKPDKQRVYVDHSFCK